MRPPEEQDRKGSKRQQAEDDSHDENQVAGFRRAYVVSALSAVMGIPRAQGSAAQLPKGEDTGVLSGCVRTP